MPGLLEHTPADVLSYLLIQLGLGVLPPAQQGQWVVSAHREPDQPTTAITCRDTQGINEGRTNPDNERQEHPGVQIRIRANTPAQGGKKANQIGIALDGVVNTDISCPAVPLQGINAATYLINAITRRSTIAIPLGEETPATIRSLHTINVILVLHKIS